MADESAKQSAEIPPYESLLKRNGISHVAGIRDMPKINKSMVREAGIRMPAPNVDPATLRQVRTGGTTGSPTRFYLDPRASERKAMCLNEAWEPLGVRPGDPIAVLTARFFRKKSASHELRNLGTRTLWLGGAPLNDPLLRQHYFRLLQFAPTLV